MDQQARARMEREYSRIRNAHRDVSRWGDSSVISSARQLAESMIAAGRGMDSDDIREEVRRVSRNGYEIVNDSMRVIGMSMEEYEAGVTEMIRSSHGFYWGCPQWAIWDYAENVVRRALVREMSAIIDELIA